MDDFEHRRRRACDRSRAQLDHDPSLRDAGDAPVRHRYERSRVDRPLLPLDQRDWMAAFFPTQIAIIESREVAARAHEDLRRSASGSPAGSEGAVGSNAVPSVDDIMGGRSAALVKDSRLVTVGFLGPNPQTAAQIANALARAYVEQNADFKMRASGEASDWLTKQVDQQRKLVDESEAALQRYRRQHEADALFTNKVGAEQQNIVVEKLSQLQGAVTKARTDTIEKEALYRQVRVANGNREALDTVPPIANDPYVQRLKGELSELQRQMAQSSKELGERHPDILKLQGAIQTTDAKLQTEISNHAVAIEKDFEAAQVARTRVESRAGAAEIRGPGAERESRRIYGTGARSRQQP
jgi:uncharacterized protein involved in exopolysaccharide biosynthesis